MMGDTEKVLEIIGKYHLVGEIKEALKEIGFPSHNHHYTRGYLHALADAKLINRFTLSQGVYAFTTSQDNEYVLRKCPSCRSTHILFDSSIGTKINCKCGSCLTVRATLSKGVMLDIL